MASASSSSSRKSRGAAGMDVTIEIFGKAFRTRSHARVFGKMCRIERVMVGQTQGPSTTFGDRDLFDIEAGQDAGRQRRVVHQIAVVDLLDSNDRLRRGVRHGREFADASDPDVA